MITIALNLYYNISCDFGANINMKLDSKLGLAFLKTFFLRFKPTFALDLGSVLALQALARVLTL